MRAQEILKRMPAGAAGRTTEMARLIQELDIHQAELELQNEDLARAQRDADDARARYQELYARAPIAYLTLDDAGAICEANDAALALLGVVRERILGAKLGLFISPSSICSFNAALSGARSGQPQRCEVRLLRPGASEAVSHVEVVSDASPSSPPGLRVRVALVDITAEARLRIRLAEREQLLSRMFEACPDALIVTDQSARIELVNPRAEQLFGRAGGELIGTNVSAFIEAPSAQEPGSPSVWTTSNRRGAREVSGCKADGKRFPAQLSLSSFQAGGRLLRVGIVRDLTYQQELERQLLHARKIEAIGTLASGIAHDFNNLLMSIIGCAELSLGAIPEGNPAKRFVEDVISTAERGATLTRQLLDFSRKRSSSVAAVNVDELVLSSQRLLTRLLPESIKLSVEVRAEGMRMLAEHGQLEQILLNLAVNARDAMPQGGVLRIRTSVLEFSSERRHSVGHDGVDGERRHILVPPGSYVVLSVTDSGTGMDRETQARAFEPFFTTKEVGAGTGLGLASVFGIVKRLGGYLDLRSAPGEGTAFTFYIPRYESADLAVPPSSAPKLLPALRRIGAGQIALVVEDEPLVLLTVRHYLEALGYQTLTATNGLQGIEVGQGYTGKIDLLLSDVVMPECNGGELASALLKARPALQVVFMSGNQNDDLMARNLLPPGARVLQKPFTLQQLTDHILSQRRIEVLN